MLTCHRPPLPDLCFADYASKDFLWPPLVRGGTPRRVNAGWAQHVAIGGSGPQALMREVTFNAQLQQLQWLPPAETQRLRTTVLANQTTIALPGSSGADYDLGLPAGAGLQSEVIISFPLPPAQGRLSLLVMGAADGANATEIYVENHSTDGGGTIAVGVVPAAINGTETLEQRATLRLARGEARVEVRVFVDRFMGEAFVQQGRQTFVKTPSPSLQLCNWRLPCFAELGSWVFQTFDAPPPADGHGGMRLRSNGQPASGVAVTAWRLGSIWVSPEEVLATSRADEYTTGKL